MERAQKGCGYILLLLWLLAVPSLALCQKENIPVPEYFGIYAVSDAHLIKLDAQQVHADKSVGVPLGQRNGVGDILQGRPVATSVETQVPEFASDLQIIVFSQAGGVQTPLDIAQSLHLERFLFVRTLRVDTGFPQNVRRSGAENRWEAGDAPELLGASMGDHAKPLEFLVKPFPSHQDMVVAVLPDKLSPGVYRLRVGEADPLTGKPGLIFAVPPVKDGEAASCVDAAVSYLMGLSKNAFTPCVASSQGPLANAPQTAAAGSPATSPAPDASEVSPCGNYAGCFSSGLNAYKSSDWQGAVTGFQSAASQRPDARDPWIWLGRAYLRNRQNKQASDAWDKALSLGADLTIGVCHERTMQPCERGDLSLSVKSVSFLASGSLAVFAAAPSDVIPKGVFNNVRAHHVSFGLEAEGRKYSFDFLPLGVTCQIQLLVQCPDSGTAQQVAVANYVVEVLPKLASGAFASSRAQVAEGTIDTIGTTTLGGKDLFTLILTPAHYKAGERQPAFAVDAATRWKCKPGDTVRISYTDPPSEAKALQGTAAELRGVVVGLVVEKSGP